MWAAIKAAFAALTAAITGAVRGKRQADLDAIERDRAEIAERERSTP